MSTEPGDLLRAAAAGDETAWRALVDRFGGLVWSVARAYRLDRADAEDVFQTTWLRLAEYLTRIKNPEGVGSWLAVTARNEAFRVIRVRARVLPSGHLADLPPDRAWIEEESPERAALDSEQAVLDQDRNRRMWTAFELLPERCQRLLRVLIASPPPSYAEVADVLDMPVGSIGPTRLRCLRLLRTVLTQAGI